jgi:predicted HicB family RNase H-like nuclease
MEDKPLDGKEDLEIDMPKEELFRLMMIAHERDITLNQLIESILREEIEKLENGNSKA